MLLFRQPKSQKMSNSFTRCKWNRRLICYDICEGIKFVESPAALKVGLYELDDYWCDIPCGLSHHLYVFDPHAPENATYTRTRRPAGDKSARELFTWLVADNVKYAGNMDMVHIVSKEIAWKRHYNRIKECFSYKDFS